MRFASLAAGLPCASHARERRRLRSAYAPTWNSIDSRPTPAWWSDAKFGIFIHWGVYSVPAFAPKGEYAEWYWERIGRPGNPDPSSNDAKIRRETRAFHERVYGKDFDVRRFRAAVPRGDVRCGPVGGDLPALRREVRGAGVEAPRRLRALALARSERELGPPVELGRCRARSATWSASSPPRSAASDLEMGFYFSLYEWFNPLWLSGRRRRLRRAPHVSAVQGPGDALLARRSSSRTANGICPREKWRAPELLAWLFNDSPVADKVVVNDRWGKESRHRHGGYYTTEYGAGLPGATHAWEENRGIGHSYGYNRNEDLADYATGATAAAHAHRYGEPRRQPAAQRRARPPTGAFPW